MRQTTVPLLLILAVLLNAVPAYSVSTKGGIAFPLSPRSPMPVALIGKLMTVQVKLWSATGGLGGGEHVQYEARIKNTSKAMAFYSIHVAVFDKQWNLIAADGFTQIFGQEPGKTDVHGGNLYIPKSELGRIAAFQISFHDDVVNIGKR